MNDTKKTCKTCKEEKPLSEFGIVNRNPDGHLHICKICYAEKKKEKLSDRQYLPI